MTENNQIKKCPYCGQEILTFAKKCRYCGHWIEGDETHMMRCYACGELIDRNSESCPYCGEQIGKETAMPFGDVLSESKTESEANVRKDETPSGSSVKPEEPSVAKDPTKSMSFTLAVKRCYRLLPIYEGRVSRREFWWFALFAVLVNIALLLICALIGYVCHSLAATLIVAFLGNLALMLPALSAGTRRLHDVGKSGWWWFIAYVPIVGPFVLLYYLAKKSDDDNEYGAVDYDTEEIPKATTRDKVITGIVTGVTLIVLVGNLLFMHTINQYFGGDIGSFDTELFEDEAEDSTEDETDEIYDESEESTEEDVVKTRVKKIYNYILNSRDGTGSEKMFFDPEFRDAYDKVKAIDDKDEGMEGVLDFDIWSQSNGAALDEVQIKNVTFKSSKTATVNVILLNEGESVRQIKLIMQKVDDEWYVHDFCYSDGRSLLNIMNAYIALVGEESENE